MWTWASRKGYAEIMILVVLESQRMLLMIDIYPQLSRTILWLSVLDITYQGSTFSVQQGGFLERCLLFGEECWWTNMTSLEPCSSKISRENTVIVWMEVIYLKGVRRVMLHIESAIRRGIMRMRIRVNLQRTNVNLWDQNIEKSKLSLG